MRKALVRVLGVLALVAACDARIEVLADRACPCAAGYTCCAASQRCVADGETCVDGTDADAPDAGRFYADATPTEPSVCTGTMCDGLCVDLATDPGNCGACFANCGVGHTCTAGVCTCPGGAACPLLGSNTASNVCGLDARCHTETDLDVGDTAFTEKLIFVGSDIVGVGTSRINVAEPLADDELFRANVADGGVSLLASAGAEGANSIGDYATDGTSVFYVVDQQQTGATPAGSQIIRAGDGLVLASRNAVSIAATAGFVYWITDAGGLERCATSGCNGSPESLGSATGTIFADGNDLFISHASGILHASTSAPSTFAPFATQHGDAFALDAQNAYFTEGDTVYRCARAGCSVAASAMTQVHGITFVALASDGTTLFALGSDGDIYSIPVGAAGATTTAVWSTAGTDVFEETVSAATALLVDDHYFYVDGSRIFTKGGPYGVGLLRIAR